MICIIIRLTTYDRKGKISYYKYVLKLGNKLVFQPKLSTNIYYRYNELEMIDYTISNVIIKKEACIKPLYLLIFFSKIIGYYYLQNALSITKNK